MDEIEFRAKAKYVAAPDMPLKYAIPEGTWIKGDVNFRGSFEPTVKMNDGVQVPIDINTVGQYIGLNDKNRNRIYEGDIFTVNGKYPKLVRYISRRASFCIANVHDLINSQWMDIWQAINPLWWEDRQNVIEIIGNEFDNKELFEKR